MGTIIITIIMMITTMRITTKITTAAAAAKVAIILRIYMPGTVGSTLHVVNYIILTATCDAVCSFPLYR